MPRPRLYPQPPPRDLKLLFWRACREPLSLADTDAMESARVHCRMKPERWQELQEHHAGWIARYNVPARRARLRAGDAPPPQPAALHQDRKKGAVARARKRNPKPAFEKWLAFQISKVDRISNPHGQQRRRFGLIARILMHNKPKLAKAKDVKLCATWAPEY